MPVSASSTPSSVRQYVFDIGKIVEGALRGDQARVLTYTDRLRSRLEEDGEQQAALRLERLISGSPSHMAQVADIAEARRGLPVDSESRLPIADIDPAPTGTETLVLERDVGELVERFVASVQMADELMANGLNVSPSMLIHGPPGVGKTLLARSIAQRLGFPLITARTDALISSYLGSTAKNVRMLFDHAAGRPCVLFLDEFDALGKMRDDSRELGELKRVVISLLQNIDALGPDHVLLAATNHEHLLDPAIWRRFTYKLRLSPPSVEARGELFRRFLRGQLEDQDIEVLTMLAEGATGAEIKHACEDSLRAMVLGGRKELGLEGVAHTLMHSLDDDTEGAAPEDVVLRLSERLGRKASQEKIGQIVGLSQSQVSRILNAKEDRHGRRTAASNQGRPQKRR